MTEEEREELERQKEWVKARYNCTMEAVYNRLLDVIRNDVQARNDMAGKGLYEHYNPGNDPKLFSVARVKNGGEGNGPIIRIELHSCFIQVSQGDGVGFTIKPQWDEDELECLLCIDEEAYTFPQISQKAIGDLLFPEPQFPKARKGC